MRWREGRRSKNVIDRRGAGPGRKTAMGGGIVIIALLAAVFLGVDPRIILQGVGTVQQQLPAGQPGPRSAAEQEAADFVSVVLADTEDTWSRQFQRAGSRYQLPQLVLFSGAVNSACGFASAAAGPFYCPGDNRLYLDLAFLSELKRMGASGDFAVAYVIAHEVGHHIQNLQGIARQVQAARQRMSQREGNALQVRMELQADCYAGVWGHYYNQRGLLERGDVEEGLQAAAAVGDDHLQKMAGRRVTPESFTHGTSAQRMEWFRRGFESGDVGNCDTFGS